jgi:hypothetical protein
VPGRRGVEEDETRGALRRRGREERREPRAFLRRPEDGRLGADVVEDRAQVVHARLERRHLAHAVGEAGAALVDQREAREGRELAGEADEQRLLPHREQVAGEAAHEDEVDRPVADRLVGDRDVAAAGIADVRGLVRRRRHRASTAPARP